MPYIILMKINGYDNLDFKGNIIEINSNTNY